MNETDHDILIEIRSDLKHVITQQCDQECRLRELEQQNNRWIGKGNAIAAVTSFLVAVGTLAIGIYSGIVR